MSDPDKIIDLTRARDERLKWYSEKEEGHIKQLRLSPKMFYCFYAAALFFGILIGWILWGMPQ